jgi:hypothetical protein
MLADLQHYAYRSCNIFYVLEDGLLDQDTNPQGCSCIQGTGLQLYQSGIWFSVSKMIRNHLKLSFNRRKYSPMDKRI